MLTSQLRVLMKDLKEERKERKKLQKEMKERNKRVDEQEKMIRNLEALYGRSRDTSPGRNDATPSSLVRFIHPYHPVEEMCQLGQQREAVSPRNDMPVRLFCGGEIKACYPEEL